MMKFQTYRLLNETLGFNLGVTHVPTIGLQSNLPGIGEGGMPPMLHKKGHGHSVLPGEPHPGMPGKDMGDEDMDMDQDDFDHGDSDEHGEPGDEHGHDHDELDADQDGDGDGDDDLDHDGDEHDDDDDGHGDEDADLDHDDDLGDMGDEQPGDGPMGDPMAAVGMPDVGAAHKLPGKKSLSFMNYMKKKMKAESKEEEEEEEEEESPKEEKSTKGKKMPFGKKDKKDKKDDDKEGKGSDKPVFMMKKKCSAGDDQSMQGMMPMKKDCGKGCKAKMKKESSNYDRPADYDDSEAGFWDRIKRQAKEMDMNQKWDSGMHDFKKEDVLLPPPGERLEGVPADPRPGEVGFAPQSRVGSSDDFTAEAINDILKRIAQLEK
jgi:hypothetical protein